MYKENNIYMYLTSIINFYIHILNIELKFLKKEKNMVPLSKGAIDTKKIWMASKCNGYRKQSIEEFYEPFVWSDLWNLKQKKRYIRYKFLKHK